MLDEPMSMLAFMLFLSPLQVQDDSYPLGTNLAGFADWSTQWPLVDVFKMSRPWVGQMEGAEWGKGGSLDVDEFGNVKSLKPGQFAETVIYSNGHYPTGNYTLTWKGTGIFEAHLGATVTSSAPGQATIGVSGDKGIYLMLKKVDPVDPPHDIHLLMPGYSLANSPFHPIFLQRMSLYRCLRFMDWGATNNSPVRAWSERTLPEQATYTGASGVPLETMIDLANEKVADPWFCVPHQASDDYVKQMAKLIKDRLKPNLRIVVEYSNECWNNQFGQAKWCVEEGRKLKLSDSDREAGLRYYSQRSLEIFALFEEVLGGRNRLTRVLSSQAADPTTGSEILNWKNAYKKADALAIAPYFGYELGGADKLESIKTSGLDGIFKTINSELDSTWASTLEAYSKLARKNGIRLFSYEGGQHLVARGDAQSDGEVNSLFDAANRDSRMKDAYLAALKTWRRNGGSLFMHFTDCASYSKFGRWGTIEFQDQDPQTSWKNQALIQYALFPDR